MAVRPDRWATVERLYHAAQARPVEQRASFLAEACAGDDELRREVESLLTQHGSASDALTRGAVAAAAGLVSDIGRSTMVGRRFGVYHVLSPLGAGGMGEVYRARDTRLGRDVAIKIVPHEFTSLPDRLARCEREARMLAALNHPHIAAIYGIEDDEGIHALVLELVDGETLAERIARGPLPVAHALEIARQIADALDAAHEKGIVHRDLKPANIKITPEGAVKVLDFGLAKLAAPTTEDGISGSPTVTVGGTHAGLIVGTAAYMSPEQARGQAVDKRTDIWAFGCVLFEMLSGRAAFARETMTDTLAAILEREPEWPHLPGSTPANMRRLLQRCLEKDVRRRLRDIGDAGVELDDRCETLQAPAVPRGARRRAFVFAASILSIGTVAAAVLVFGRPGRAPAEQALAGGAIEQVTFDAGLTAMPALSPDGRLLAYASDRAGRGDLDIWVQQVTGGAPLRLTQDPADDQSPSFSPDGSQIVFRSERDGGGLYLIPSLGGDARRIGRDGRSPRFSPDGRQIAYEAGPWRGQLSNPNAQAYVQALAGGDPVRILPDFASAREPVWAPDGRSLIVVGRRDRTSPLVESFDVWFVPLDGRPPARTGALDLRDFRSAIDAFPVETGVLGTWTEAGVVVSFPSALWSIPLSTSSGRVSGPPKALTFGAGLYLHSTASVDGQLVFAAAESPRVVERAPLNNDDPALLLYTDGWTGPSRPSQSLDGSKIVYERAVPGSTEYWMKTVHGGPDRMVARVPGRRNGLDATLSPDGARIGYTVDEDTDKSSGFVIEVGAGVPLRLCEGCVLFGFLSDSRHVLAIDNRNSRVRLINITSGEAQDVLRADRGAFGRTHASPNDKWLAFQRTDKVWVAPITPGQPPPEASWAPVDEPTISGRPAGWSVDSRVLYLLLDTDGFRCLWGQRVDETTGHLVGKPYAVRHFHNTVLQQFSTSYGNAITADGFLYGGGILKANLWRLRLAKQQ